MKKRLISIALALVLALSILPTAALAAGLTNFQKVNNDFSGKFADVVAGAWYTESVQTAYELGLVQGSGPNVFNPNGNITIGSALALACRLHSIYQTGSANFVQGNPWYQVYVDYAVANGIITAGQFSDYSANATRRQFAAILAKALPADALTAINAVADGQLPDVAMSSAYADSIYQLYRAGVLTGNDRFGTFAPDTTIGRSSVAAIVARMAVPALRQSLSLEKGPTLVSSVTLNQTTLNLSLNEAQTLTASYAPDDAQNKFVTWTSSNTAVATVDNSGAVRAVAAGTAVITATTSNGASAVCTVTVSSNQMGIYDFLVNYVKAEGSKAYASDYGDLYVWLSSSIKYSNNNDWRYYLYLDSSTGKLTLEGDYLKKYTGTYTYSFTTGYKAMEIPRDLSAPYYCEYISESGSSKKTATAYLDPATFTSSSTINFLTYESSFLSPDPVHDQDQLAIGIRIGLRSLKDDILEPNGYTLADLGFTQFS